MINANKVFQSLISQTTIPMGLFRYIDDQKVPIDASDLLRWEWVLAVSALDKYIHDIVRIGMVEEFLGIRPRTKKFNTFRIDMSTYTNLMHSQSPEVLFESEIKRQHSFLAFQHPEKLIDALSLIWSEEHKWEAISRNMTSTISVADLKTKLNNIVIRRDQIVHEGDCFIASLPLQQQQISEADVQDVIDFISEFVQSIQICVKLTPQSNSG